MNLWTIYRFQAGDPRERWLHVGQLGTETEQNAIAAARAIWGDGSENHWHYGAEPYPPPVEMVSYPIDLSKMPMASAEELEGFTATKSATRTGPEMDYRPLAGASTPGDRGTQGQIDALRKANNILAGKVEALEKSLCGGGRAPYDPSRSPSKSVSPPEILLPEGELKDKAERIVEATNGKEWAEGIVSAANANPEILQGERVKLNETEWVKTPETRHRGFVHYWEVLGRTAGTASFLIGVTEAETYDQAMDNARGEAGDLWNFFNVRRLHPDEVEAMKLDSPELFETWGYPPNVNHRKTPAERVAEMKAAMKPKAEPIGGPLTGFDSMGHG